MDTLDFRCRIIKGIQKGTIILTTTHEHQASVKRQAHANEPKSNAKALGRVQGLGRFKVQRLEFKVQGLGLKVWD